MSAPEVGDRVRVIAGQWVGWDAKVLDRLHSEFVWVNLTSTDPAHETDQLTFTRCLRVAEVEKVPTTPVRAPSGDAGGSDAGLDPEAAHGAHRGGKR